MGDGMKVLDLFSGIGGFSLGLERAGMETVAFCEFEPHAQKVLRKHWPNVPIHSDVRSLDGKQYRGAVDVVCGGFPCQDLSTAGTQAGFGGERSSLYREMLRIISECRPRYAIFENVTGLLTGESGRWFGQFLYDLAEIGFDAEWHCISASELGAHHHRDRVWIVAYPNETQLERGGLSKRIQKELANSYGRTRNGSASKILADSMCQRQQGQGEPINSQYKEKDSDWETGKSEYERVGQIWEAEPRVGRVVDGVWKKSYSHRLARLGNSVVPQIPEAIGKAIMGAV
jgi:DNA (cytosine-5)-methyltransferase 1